MSYPENRMLCSETTHLGRRCRNAAGKNGLCGRHSRSYGGSDVIDPLEVIDWSQQAEALAGLARICRNRSTGEANDTQHRKQT